MKIIHKEVLLLGLFVVVATISAFVIPQSKYDYIRLEDGMKGLIVSCEGVGGIEQKKVESDGHRVKFLMEAIEVYEARGFELLNVYGNNAGHFAVMRKKTE